METIYDWVSVAIFAALVVIFLQRSASPEPTSDTIWHYLPPAAGCAGANYLGNEGNDLAAIGLLAAVVAYTIMVLKPFKPSGQ